MPELTLIIASRIIVGILRLSRSRSKRTSAAISLTVPGIVKIWLPDSGYWTLGGGGGGSTERSYLLFWRRLLLSTVLAKQVRTGSGDGQGKVMSGVKRELSTTSIDLYPAHLPIAVMSLLLKCFTKG